VPTAPAVNIGGLTAAGNAAGAGAQASVGGKLGNQAPLPSVWIVEILGYGGGDQSVQEPPAKRRAKLHAS
jgi:hypothetical protein